MQDNEIESDSLLEVTENDLPGVLLWAVTESSYRAIAKAEDVGEGETLYTGEAPVHITRRTEAESNKAAQLATAAAIIAPLQDAADLDMATDEETSALLSWKKYRVLLNRVDTSATDIVWPEQPAA